jgi:hypothetical protein
VQHAALKAFPAFVDRLFVGSVPGWVYVWLRVSLASLFLVRHSDWLEPLLALEHHHWVDGLEFAWSAAAEPALSSPLGLAPALNEPATTVLVWLRTLLAFLLLFGLRARLAAASLAIVSYVLMASDRYHYFHHLHQFYLALLWLSLAPIERRSAGLAPIWPLQLLRAFVVGIYLASGLAKLSPGWWSGEVLETLQRVGTVSGAGFDLAAKTLGVSAVAKLTVLVEIAVALLLCLPPTRRAAVVLGIFFHAAIEASMDVSTFSAQMVVLLVAFWSGPVKSDP